MSTLHVGVSEFLPMLTTFLLFLSLKRTLLDPASLSEAVVSHTELIAQPGQTWESFVTERFW